MAGPDPGAEPRLQPGGLRAGQRYGRGHGERPRPGTCERRGDRGVPRGRCRGVPAAALTPGAIHVSAQARGWRRWRRGRGRECCGRRQQTGGARRRETRGRTRGGRGRVGRLDQSGGGRRNRPAPGRARRGPAGRDPAPGAGRAGSGLAGQARRAPRAGGRVRGRPDLRPAGPAGSAASRAGRHRGPRQRPVRARPRGQAGDRARPA